MSTLKNIKNLVSDFKDLYEELYDTPNKSKSQRTTIPKHGSNHQERNAGEETYGTPKQSTMPKPRVQTSGMGLYDSEIEKLIDLAIVDGALSEKEKQVLFKKAQSKGIDLDEFEIVLDARLSEYNQMHNKKSNSVNLSAPKSDKFGDVRRCPNCNSVVKAFSPVCTECGYEFTNVDASLSYEKLSNKLLETENLQKRINIIETFPIPNAKADLLDFLTSAKPHITDLSDPCRSAYWKKYQECMNKVEISFNNDDIFKPFINNHTKLKRKVLRVKFFSWLKHLHWAWKVIIAFIIFLILGSIIEAIISLFQTIFQPGV